MIFKIVVLLLCLIFFVGISFGDQLLIAEPLEDVDYYVVLINGIELTLEPSFDMIFAFLLSNLKDGKYRIKITSGSFKNGEGGEVPLFIDKRTRRNGTTYTIKRDRSHKESDSWYEDRFEEPLRITTKKDSIRRRGLLLKNSRRHKKK